MRLSCWQDLICVFGLDFTARYYERFRSPLRNREEVRKVLERILRECPYFPDRISETDVEGFLSGLAPSFDKHSRDSFLCWAELVWNPLDGPSWDWFAYQFALGRWYNEFNRNGTDMLCVGAHAEFVAMRFRSEFREPVNLFRNEINGWSNLSISPWDRQVLELARLSLIEHEPGKFGSLAAIVSEPIRMARFMEFWRLLTEQVGVAALLPIHSHVERLVKAELPFPPRSLLTPADLPFPPPV